MEKTIQFNDLSEKAQAVLTFLGDNANGAIYTVIAEGTGLANNSVIGVLNGLSRKELVGKEDVTVPGVDKNGKEITKDLKSYFLTDTGVALV